MSRLLATSNALLDGKLLDRLRVERAKTPPTSYETLARIFASEYGVDVTGQTVRNWDGGLTDDAA